MVVVVTLAACDVHAKGRRRPTNPLVVECRKAAQTNRCQQADPGELHPTRLLDADLCAASQALARAYVGSAAFASFVAKKGRLPTVASGTILNKTEEKIDHESLLSWFERILQESDCSTVRQRDADADLALKIVISDAGNKVGERRTVTFEATLTAAGRKKPWRGKHRLEKALAEEESTGSTSTRASSLYSSGRQHLRAGETDAAARMFEQCIQEDPAYCPCYRLLGETFARAGKGPKAVEQYRRYVKTCQHAPDVAEIQRRIRQFEHR